jgi:ATP-binding cassette subfamily B protein
VSERERETNPRIFRRGVATVARFARRQPVTFTVSLVGAIVYAVASVASTVVLGRATDEAIVPAFTTGVDGSTLAWVAAAILAVAFLRGGSIVLRRYFAALTTFRTQADLRRQVSSRYLDVPLSYHRAHPAGELLARADSDVIASTELLNAVPFTLGVFALIVVAIASLATVDVSLVIVAALLFPTLAVINRVYTNRIHGPVAVVQERVAEVSRVAHESFDGALVVKTLGRADAEVARLDVAADHLRQARVGVGRIRGSFEPVIDALPNLGTIILLLVGAWQISEGRLEVGGLVQAMALFGLLATPMRVVGFFLQELPRAVVAAGRIDTVLAEPAADRPTSADAVDLPAGPLSLAFEHVSFAYGAQPGAPAEPVLDDVTFRVAPGEVVALAGSTGAGKTTLCELAVRAEDPTAGTVALGGVDLRRLDPDGARAAVALVFQEAFLFAAPLRENVALGADVDDDEVLDALRLACVDDLVSELEHGLDTVVGERGVTLSGGQRQRIALARALVRRPRVLLLDDATSAVDPVVEARILRQLRQRDAITTLVVAHRRSTIELADRVVFLRGGRVEGIGSHDELLDLPAYAAIARAYEQGRPA